MPQAPYPHKTPFLDKQKNNSDTIWNKYKGLIIPPALGVQREDVKYPVIANLFSKYLDKELGTDATCMVKYCTLDDCIKQFERELWIKWLIQYRFRDVYKWQDSQDLTVTLFNLASGELGELSKLVANLFVYGYCDFETMRLLEVIVVNCNKLRDCILDRSLRPKKIPTNKRSNQPLLPFDFDDLKRLNLVLLHWKVIDNRIVPQPNTVPYGACERHANVELWRPESA
jgi:hypothetical protein